MHLHALGANQRCTTRFQNPVSRTPSAASNKAQANNAAARLYLHNSAQGLRDELYTQNLLPPRTNRRLSLSEIKRLIPFTVSEYRLVL